MLIQRFLWVFIGGTLGSISRELIGQWWAPPPPWDGLPILAINVSACLLIGWLYARQQRLHPHLMSFAAIGFCGGFSTFSHFTEQTLTLIQVGDLGLAVANVSASIILGLGAALLGERLGAAGATSPPVASKEATHR